MSFEYEVTASFNAPNRKHRFNVDETRGTNLAKVDAEYYNEKEQAWRKVRSENTKSAYTIFAGLRSLLAVSR